MIFLSGENGKITELVNASTLEAPQKSHLVQIISGDGLCMNVIDCTTVREVLLFLKTTKWVTLEFVQAVVFDLVHQSGVCFSSNFFNFFCTFARNSLKRLKLAWSSPKIVMPLSHFIYNQEAISVY